MAEIFSFRVFSSLGMSPQALLCLVFKTGDQLQMTFGALVLHAQPHSQENDVPIPHRSLVCQ